MGYAFNKQWKVEIPLHNACWYLVKKMPPWKYKNGQLKVKFTKIKTVNVNIWKGTSLRDMEPFQPGPIEVDKIILVPEGDNFIITAYPEFASMSGGYEWEYWIDGVPYDEYELKYNQLFR